MINIIYSEILKLKKSKILLLIIVATLAMPIMLNGAILLSQDDRTFESYVFNSEGINFWMIFGILFSIVGGYVFSREYSEKTDSTLFSYPCSRTKIFFGKLIVVYILIFLTCVIQSVFAYLSYYLLFGVLDKNLVIDDIIVNLKAMLFQMSIVIIPILLANLKKNMVLPIIYGVFSMCLSLVMENVGFEYSKYNPLIGSVLCFSHQYEEYYVDVNSSAIATSVCFIIFIMISIYQYSKTDMV